MSTQKPSEHAMRATQVWYGGDMTGLRPSNLPETIDTHAIRPAVEEAVRVLVACIDPEKLEAVASQLIDRPLTARATLLGMAKHYRAVLAKHERSAT